MWGDAKATWHDTQLLSSLKGQLRSEAAEQATADVTPLCAGPALSWAQQRPGHAPRAHPTKPLRGRWVSALTPHLGPARSAREAVTWKHFRARALVQIQIWARIPPSMTKKSLASVFSWWGLLQTAAGSGNTLSGFPQPSWQIFPPIRSLATPPSTSEVKSHLPE